MFFNNITKIFSLLTILIVALVSVGCSEPNPTCGEDTRIESGSFSEFDHRNYYVNAEPPEDDPYAEPPYEHQGIDPDGPLGVGERTLEVDREAGTVTVIFESEGQEVVQHWTFDPEEIENK
jgi:hypothetical protein